MLSSITGSVTIPADVRARVLLARRARLSTNRLEALLSVAIEVLALRTIAAAGFGLL